jgi:hypothetical protein
VEEENFVFNGAKILALDSAQKDPNCWLKVGVMA